MLNLFYQIFDKGVANDGEGREINFRNTLILMTSNLGSDRISETLRRRCAANCRGAGESHSPRAQQALQTGPAGADARGALLPGRWSGCCASLSRSNSVVLGERLSRRQLDFSYSQGLVDHWPNAVPKATAVRA